jgi:hypothetical protein
MNPAPRRDYGDHWYVYAGDWLERQAHSRSLPKLLLLLFVLACGAIGYRWGDPWVGQKIEESRAAAAAWEAVAASVKRAESNHDLQNRALAELLLKNVEMAPSVRTSGPTLGT